MTITEWKRLRSPSQPVGRWIRPKSRLAIYLRDNLVGPIKGMFTFAFGISKARKVLQAIDVDGADVVVSILTQISEG